MVCLGFEPRAAGEVGWKVHTITLSYGGSTFMLSLIRVNPCLFLLGGSNWLQKELGIRRYVDFSGIECKLNTILTPHLVYINLTIYSAQFVKTFLGNLLSKLFRIYKTFFCESSKAKIYCRCCCFSKEFTDLRWFEIYVKIRA